jgi:hypothetical protein
VARIELIPIRSADGSVTLRAQAVRWWDRVRRLLGLA